MHDEGNSVAAPAHRRTAPLTAVALSVALALTGCTPGGEEDTSSESNGTTGATGTDEGTATDDAASGPGTAAPDDDASSSDAAAPGGTGEAGLDRFYSQQLDWSECESGFECASLTVPVDYADPDGPTLDLSLLRASAGGEAQGSLVINPGGPGGSGVEYAMMSGSVFSAKVRDAYDIVGFDPRGVGRSAPITCVDDAEMDQILGANPDPETDAELEEAIDSARAFAEACGERAPDLVGHLSTVEAARDMDVLRAALGEEQLDYFGASYGTFLGTTYATLFPEQVGRLVLDGAIDPALTGTEMSLGQAEGFERATRAYVEDCVSRGDCPLGDDVDGAMAALPEFLQGLRTDPLPVTGDTVTELTEGWATYGVIVAMYSEQSWPILTQALQQARDGDGTMLMFLANAYASRNSDGTYQDNSMQAIYAVNCLDRPDRTGVDDEDIEATRERFIEASPTWGRVLSGVSSCEFWPAQAAETIEDYSAAGSDPIVVIGTTRDPATPYEWSEILADTLDAGVLLTYDGDGHTAYQRGSDCIDNAVDAYLVDGTVPEDGLTC